jgi:D-glycero-D-manno-heptose 1,7-bisphosphate phosphatase
VIGDKVTDFQFGRNLGATPCLVRTGYGDTESARLVQLGLEKADVFDNVLEAVKWIVQKEREELS